MITTINSMSMVIRKDNPANFNDVNLSILMIAIAIHAEIKSLRRMLLSLKNQPIVVAIPHNKLSNYIIRN